MGTPKLTPEQIKQGRQAAERLAESFKAGREQACMAGDPPTAYPEPGTQNPKPACKNHPDRPAKIDSLGRSMGLCQECVSKRGIDNCQTAVKAGLTGAPFYIPLNKGQYFGLKVWLEEQAAENERTLQAEIMYRLRLSMRGAKA